MLGDKLQKLRQEKKLTQEQLSKAIGITRGTYAHYEINKRQPDYETLQKLADFFDVSIDYLLGRTDKPDEDPISVAFSHGGEELTEDEKEHLEAELKKYRELKARFMREKNKD